MVFFGKKRGIGISDIDLDVPPEPPKIGMEEEVFTEEPIDEELMLPKPAKIGKAEDEELPEIPPLPEVEEELPELPKEEELELPKIEEMPKVELPEIPPLPETKKERKGLFSFFKAKKIVEMPKLEEALPPLPEVEEELPKIEEEISMPKIKEEEPIKQIMKKVKPTKEFEKIEVKPKFIMINDFRSIQDIINNSRRDLKEASEFFAGLEENKGIRDKKYEEWHTVLQDMQKKIMFIDKILFQEAT